MSFMVSRYCWIRNFLNWRLSKKSKKRPSRIAERRFKSCRRTETVTQSLFCTLARIFYVPRFVVPESLERTLLSRSLLSHLCDAHTLYISTRNKPQPFSRDVNDAYGTRSVFGLRLRWIQKLYAKYTCARSGFV